MGWENEFYQVLRDEFEELKKKNGRYSLRAFAHRLKVSPSALSQMMSGKLKWELSAERAQELLLRLSLSDAQKTRLLTLMGRPFQRERKNVDVKDFSIILDETYPTVLACHDLPKEERTVEKIGRRIGVHPEDVGRVIDELVKKGYLKRNYVDDVIESTPEYWAAGDGPPQQIIRQYHKKNMLLAAKMVDQIPCEERHFSSMTFVGRMGQLENLRQEIRNFQEKVMNLMNQDDQNDEVFRFSVCLFPIRNLSEGH
jgi:uncharacterized protein (TIGR02147 family)